MKINEYKLLSPGSIRTRLTLFYSLAVFVLFLLAVLLLYWVTMNLLYKADYEFLGDEVDTIQYIMMSEPVDRAALHEAVVEAPFSPEGSIYRYYVRIYDEKMHLVMETPGAGDVLQTENYFKAAELLGKRRYFWYSKNDSDYLLIQSPIKLGPKNKMGLLQIALDISYQHHLIQDHNKIIAVLLAGTLFSLLIGFFIASRGLRSLYLLTQTVQKITVTSLDRRIDPGSWPTELSGLGVAFNQMLDRIEKSFIRLKQFSADLSHELRAPITNMIGHTESMLSHGGTEREYREVMQSNLEELQRISSVIENILFLARAEDPQFDIKMMRLNVRKEIELVCEFYQSMADERNIQILFEGEASVEANADMFRRMISHIMSNALKFTPLGGRIRFDIKDLPDDVQICLIDSGVGIAEEHLTKIFDRFYRVESSQPYQAGGVGLGLAIVKAIVAAHHGTVAIQSVMDKGTVVTITLPKSTK